MQTAAREGPGTATRQELPQLIHLWSLCFQETMEDSAYFLSRRFVPEQTFVWRRDGSICAAIYLIPVQAGAYRGGYLYAIGTHPALQGQGIFRRLHQYVTEQAAAAGLAFLCLIPAEPSLFALYRGLGYASWYGRQQISQPELCVPDLSDAVSFMDCTPEAFLLQMERSSDSSRLLYESDTDRQLVLQQYLHYEGFFKQCTIGQTSFVLAGIQEADTLYLSQCSGSQPLLMQAGAALVREYSCNRMYLPPVGLSSSNTPYAMGLWLTPHHTELPAQSLGLMYT